MRAHTALAVTVALALSAGACASTADVVVSGAGDDEAAATAAPDPTAGPEPTATTESATEAEPTPEPGTAPRDDPAALLLQEADLPGWRYTRATPFGREPTWVADDCPPMNVAFGAHAEPGIRIRASSGETRFRQTVVEMSTVDDANAVLDAAADVWEDCAQLSFDGSAWWNEPVGIPSPEGWRAQALALGSADAIWIIGWWQRESRLVFVDLNGENAWEALQPLFDGIAGRLAATPVRIPPVGPTPSGQSTPPPTPSALPELVPAPTPTTEPLPTPTPDTSFPPSDEDWTDHPLASLALDPAELGPGWAYQFGSVNAAAPSDPDDIVPGCSVEAPPTLDGFRLEYEREDDAISESIELIVGNGDAEGAQAAVDAFRAVVDCDLSYAGFPGGLSEVSVTVAGADDAVVLVGARDDGFEVTAYFGVARFDDLSLVILWGWSGWGDDDSVGAPTADDVVQLIEEIASRR